MKTFNKALTITGYALLLTTAQAALADPAMTSPVKVLGSTAIGLVRTPSSFEPRLTEIVSYDNLDLETEKGVRAVYRLLQRASKEVCGGTPHGRSVIMKSSRLRCYRESLSNAVDSIDNENLTRFHTG